MSAPRRWPWLLPPLVALAVRLACLPLAAAIPPQTGDSVVYVAMARSFLRSGEFIDYEVTVRPPLFVLLTALGLDSSQTPPDAFPWAYVIQIACSVAFVALVMALAARQFGRRPGLAAGWIAALEPTCVLYASSLVMAESAALLVIVTALHLLVRLHDADDASRRRQVFLTGALGLTLGVGMLVKEVLVPFAGVVCLTLLVRRSAPWSRRLLLPLVTGGIALAVTTPWMAYTYERHGIPVMSSTATDLFLMHGNMPPTRSGTVWTDGMIAFGENATVASAVAEARATFRRALTEYPALTARRGWTKLRVLLGPEIITPTWIAHHLEGWSGWGRSPGISYFIDSWRLPSGTWARRVQILAGVATVIVFGLGAAGLALASGGPLRAVTLLLVGAMLVAYFLTWAESRYRLTLLPLLAPFAGLAWDRLTSGGTALARAERRRAERTGLAVALLLVLTVFVLPAPPLP